MGLEEELRALSKKCHDLELKNSTLASEQLDYESKNAKLQAQKKDLQARIDHVQKAVMGLMEVLSSHAVIVVRDGLIVPSQVSIQGMVPTKYAEGDERLEIEQKAKHKLNQTKLKLEKEVKDLNEKLEELDSCLSRANLEKQSKDKHIKSLNEQIAHQETLISKVNSEKKQLQDANNRVEEELSSVENKCRILNEVKTKMERTLKELNDNLDGEQKLRTEAERAKKRIEADMKQIKANVDELQVSKKDLEMQLSLARKSTIDSPLSVQVKGEHIAVPRINNQQVKDLQQRILELEEELESRCNPRTRTVNVVHVDDMALASPINPNTELVEKHKKEMTQLKTKLEQMNIKNDVQNRKLKRQIDEANADKEEAIETLNRMKGRLEKEKKMIHKEAESDKEFLGDLKTSNTEHQRKIREYKEDIKEVQTKLDKANREINKLYEIKKNLNIENCKLRDQVEDFENAAAERLINLDITK